MPFDHTGVTLNLNPVSYTHLDVYKRQVLIDRLELTLRLQHQTSGDLTASDGCHQLFQLRDLPDIGALINETAHMDWEPAAIHIVGFFAEQVEKLGITHGDQEVKACLLYTSYIFQST